MNIRGPGAGSDSAKTARMLSRLSLGSAHSTGIVAEALAGMAILAVLPRAKGQPTEDWVEEGFGWLLWLVGAVLTGVSVLWGWWWLHGPGVFGLSTEAILSEEGVFDEVAEGAGSGASVAALVGTVPSEDEDVFPSLGHEGLPEVQGTEVSGAEIGGLAQPNLEGTSDDELFGDEWEVARQMFERVERHTGLTFLQRAKLRKDLLAGGVIEPPPFLQRFGSPPEWTVSGDEAPGSSGAQGSSEAPGFGGAQGSSEAQGSGEALDCEEASEVEASGQSGCNRAELLGFLEVNGGLLLGCLGLRATEWGVLRALSRKGFPDSGILLSVRRCELQQSGASEIAGGEWRLAGRMSRP